MSKAEPILKIEPEKNVLFRGPCTEPVSVVIKLTNTTQKRACFKVQTTAPKRYLVKPATGIIDPNALVTILVTLKPLGPNDPDQKVKHMFQILSVHAPEGAFNIDTLWEDSSLEINYYKLKCVLPDSSEVNSSDAAEKVTASNPVSDDIVPFYGQFTLKNALCTVAVALFIGFFSKFFSFLFVLCIVLSGFCNLPAVKNFRL